MIPYAAVINNARLLPFARRLIFASYHQRVMVAEIVCGSTGDKNHVLVWNCHDARRTPWNVL